MGILQTLDEAGSISAIAEECGPVAHETRSVKIATSFVDVVVRDAIASPCGAKGHWSSCSSRISPLL
jgi:hypothetical protein